MTLRNHFHSFLDNVRQEGRYRTFIDLERQAAGPPYAIWRGGGGSREVVIWCSNDVRASDVLGVGAGVGEVMGIAYREVMGIAYRLDLR